MRSNHLVMCEAFFMRFHAIHATRSFCRAIIVFVLSELLNELQEKSYRIFVLLIGYRKQANKSQDTFLKKILATYKVAVVEEDTFQISLLQSLQGTLFVRTANMKPIEVIYYSLYLFGANFPSPYVYVTGSLYLFQFYPTLSHPLTLFIICSSLYGTVLYCCDHWWERIHQIIFNLILLLLSSNEEIFGNDLSRCKYRRHKDKDLTLHSDEEESLALAYIIKQGRVSKTCAGCFS